MPCPRNQFGDPSCHITEHPDFPNLKFCSTCKRKFREENIPELPAMVIIGLALLTIFIFIRAIDNSGSNRPRSSSIIFLSAQTSEETDDPIVPPMYQ